MRKIIVFAGMVLFLGVEFGFAEEITLTTYYPAPFGVYDQMVTDTLGVGDNDGVPGLTGADAPTTSGDVWIANQVKIAGGSPGEGKILTSDANGLASWQSGGLPLLVDVAVAIRDGANYQRTALMVASVPSTSKVYLRGANFSQAQTSL